MPLIMIFESGKLLRTDSRAVRVHEKPTGMHVEAQGLFHLSDYHYGRMQS